VSAGAAPGGPGSPFDAFKKNATSVSNPFDTPAVRQEFPFATAVQVWPGVRRITAPNPGMMTGPGTNTYLVGTRQVLVIDTASDNPAHLAAIKHAAAGAITAVLVTHAHPDHAPGARELARDCGVPVLGSGTALAGVRTEGFAPDRALADGESLPTDAGPLRALRTPGHAADHICYLLQEQELLFAGDHLMDDTTVVIAPPDGDMAAYLTSLRRLQQEPVQRIAPGHGRLMHGAQATLQQVIDHRLAARSIHPGGAHRLGRTHHPGSGGRALRTSTQSPARPGGAVGLRPPDQTGRRRTGAGRCPRGAVAAGGLS